MIEHKGRYEHRALNNPTECIFSEAWERLNQQQKYGRPEILDYLTRGDGVGCLGRATQDEATVAATVVQWLGSPVGFGWLTETLEKAGYELTARGKAYMLDKIDKKPMWYPEATAPTNSAVLIYVEDWEHYGYGVCRAIKVDMGTGARWHACAWGIGRDVPIDRVKWWMPLPEPPREESDGR